MKTSKFLSIVIVAICAMLMCSCNNKMYVKSQLEKIHSELSLMNPKFTTDEEFEKVEKQLFEVGKRLEVIKVKCTETEYEYIEDLYNECKSILRKNKIKGTIQQIVG